MGKLTATMVVDLRDNTGAGVRSTIGNLTRLERAQRDLELAQRGANLSRRDRAMESLMVERQRSLEERRQVMATWAARGTVAAVAVAAAAGKAYVDFAEVERRVNRIVINADKGADQIQPTITRLQKIAQDTRMGFDDVVAGVETLVASGRSLDEAMSFLPAVTMTAQASGAAISDVALSADAMSGSLSIGAGQMQKAFDILVAGGKAGKFELKDMSQYLPTLLPAFAALGYSGTEGLQKMVAMLQIVRNQAGSSGEAATYLGNVLNKVYSTDTANKFKKLGVDLPKALDRAKASGADVLDVFLDLTKQATNGDLSKLSQLFPDSEMQKGVRALLTQRDALDQMVRSLGHVDGTALRDFGQIADDTASKIQNLQTNWNKLMTQIGSGVATVANPALETLTSAIDEVTAEARANVGKDEEQRNWERQDFDARYRKLHPEAWFWQVREAYRQAKIKVGRGEAGTVFDGLNLEEGRTAGGGRTGRFPSRGVYDPAMLEIEQKRNARRKGGIPIPTPRPSYETVDQQTERERGNLGYPSPGSYDPGMKEELRRFTHRNVRRQLRNADPASIGMEGNFGVEIERQDPRAASPDQRSQADPSMPQAVTVAGTPAFTLAGNPTVTIANPPPRPNITVHMPVTINEAQDVDAVASKLGARIREEMEGLHASTNDAGL